MFATLFVLTTITAYTTSTECISKRQQTELKFCCEMEELIPRHIRTKCQEKAAADHNPGFRMYHVCQSQCLYEEMDAIDGYEVHLERLYPVTEHFPVDYRQAVRLAIDECNKLIQGAMKDKKVKREGADCPMLGSQVEMCLKAATYKNCPNSRWTASVACSKLLVTADPDCENLKDRREEMDQCCEVGKIIPFGDADECASATDEASEPRDKMACTVECKLKSLGVLNDEGIVLEKALEYADRVEGEWKDTAKAIVNTCIERATTVKNKMAEHGHTMKCSPIGGFFAMCLMKESFFQCPADKWQNTSFCNKIKSGECFPKRD
uniref:Uncharacterized protein n=1 Tax=Anopheles stephensi TaxID=30069 RepID=A0A182Y370_ANOST